MNLLDGPALLHWVLNTAPLLPQDPYLPWIRQAGWALVLAALFSAASRRSAVPQLRAGYRLLAWLLALWACIPGPWGLSYWLGLAFQTPSLMAIALSLQTLWQSLAQGRWALMTQVSGFADSGQRGPRRQYPYLALGLVLGWLLLLDSFAYLPVSLYGWGFSPPAFALMLLLALWPWVQGVRFSLMAQSPAPALLAALVVFALTRWPTGNVWDAVLDPWLFIALHLYAIAGYRARLSD